MTSLFDIDAYNDDSQLTRMRVASAVALRRADLQFGAFIKNATAADIASRLSLIEDDVKRIVAAVVAEQGFDPTGATAERIEKAITAHLAGKCDHLKDYQFKKKDSAPGDEKEESDDSDESDDDSENPKEASIREARRPKMCPYHSEVVDISLGAGDPQAGYNAMSSHAWSPNHCKGGFEGSCNFKPAMVSQQYWDDKKAEYAQRAEQRGVPSLEGTEPIMDPEPLAEAPGEGVTDIEAELAEAPSAVGEMVFAHTAADAPEGAGGTATREKLPKGDESALGGPSPKIDKDTWTGLDPIDTESANSPHKTVKQDVTDKADYDKSDFLDQADTVTTQETLPSNSGDAGFDAGGVENDGYSTDTWSESNGADPVTRTTQSASDPLANPLRDILESNFGGFLPASEVDSALADYDS
jgi:hypothetical protein